MNRSLGRLFVVILVFGTLCAHSSLACSCGKPSKTEGNCTDLKATGPSFVGTVIDIENPPDERRLADQSGLSRYRFRVDENISGFRRRKLIFTQDEGMGIAVTIFGWGNRTS